MIVKKTLTRTADVKHTPRAIQIASTYDLKFGKQIVQTWEMDLEFPDDFEVMVITGPSMAGKSVIANELFPGKMIEKWEWPVDQSLVDGFPAEINFKRLSKDTICEVLGKSGFSSAPDYLKPYWALSNGGKFRVDLARSICCCPDIIVVDEFGSYIHPDARKTAATVAAKACRKLGKKLVALVVQADCIEHFEPDVLIEITPGEPVRAQCTRGLVRRPTTELEIIRTDRTTWDRVKQHHYLDHSLHKNAICFASLINKQLAAFSSVKHFPMPDGTSCNREHRTVTVPDFQGIGIGNAISDHVASIMKATGKRYFSATSHPAMIHYRNRSPLWKLVRTLGRTAGSQGLKAMWDTSKMDASSRLSASFEYVGPANIEKAREFGILQ